MSKLLRKVGYSLIVITLAAPFALGQASIEGRPEVKELSRTELDRRKADGLMREAQSLFGLGVMRHRGDRWLEAVTLLEEAARLDPETPAALRALIPLYLSLAREEDALDSCRKVLQRDPADCHTAYQLSKLLREENRTRDGIAVLTQGVKSKRAEHSPDLLYFMLNDLAELQAKSPDFAGAADTYRRLAEHLLDQRARLLGSDTLAPEQFAVAVARAYEKVGQCHLQQKQFNEAIKAFRQSRDYLAQHPDELVRFKAVRLNWNLAETCVTQEKWEEALRYLDAYLENRPTDQEPYEKKIVVLKKLGREEEIVPALKRYSSRLPDTLGVQLVYARELAATADGRQAAESRYLDLADRFGSAEVYRGLFRFYMAGHRMVEALNSIDKEFSTINSKDEIAADVRERARDRGRAMLSVLRSEPAIVAGLLQAVEKELAGPSRMTLTHETWQLLAAMAARAKQLDKAEAIFRRCLIQAPVRMEPAIYGGLLEVLWMQRKHDAVIALCKDALDGRAQATNLELFHRSLAMAYSEKEKFEEAVAEIDKAVRLAAGPGKVFERCRKARILAQGDRHDDAIAECNVMLKDLTEADEIKQVRHTLSLVYTMKGDHEKSEAQLTKILDDDPNDPGANNDLGYQWADRNRNLDEAEKMIRKAIEVDHVHRRDETDAETENAAYLDSLGWVIFRQGKLEEARDLLEKVSTLAGGAEDPTVWDHLGDVYFRLNQKSRAKDCWEQAIKLYQHDKRGQKEGRLDEAKRKLKLIVQ